jgi:hypothetical protein
LKINYNKEMREKVERDGVGGWKGESSRTNRQGYVHRLDKVATSYYFTNLPDDVKAVDLWPKFSRFGRVGEVFIPAKVDKQGKRFGFVKFRDVQDERELLRRISNIWIDSFKLRINLSKFSRRSEANLKEDGRHRDDSKVSEEVKYSGGKTQVGRSFKSALIAKDDTVGIPGVVTNTLGEDRDRNNGKTREEVVWEVEVEEERMSKLEGAYVGYLVEDRDVQAIQNNFCMDGFHGIQVCEMGYRKILLWSNKREEVKEVIETVGWWCSMFEKVVPWSPALVTSERAIWLRCYGVPHHAWGVDLFRALAFKYGRFIEVDECTHHFKRCDFARVKVLTNERSIIDSTMAVKVLGVRFEIRVMEEGGYASNMEKLGVKRVERWPEEDSSRASADCQSFQAVVEGLSESGSDADVSESCQVLLDIEAHGRGRIATNEGGKEMVKVVGEVSENFPNILGNTLALTNSVVNSDGDKGSSMGTEIEESGSGWEGVHGGAESGVRGDEVDASFGDKEVEQLCDMGQAHYITTGPFVNYDGVTGCEKTNGISNGPKFIQTREGLFSLEGPSHIITRGCRHQKTMFLFVRPMCWGKEKSPYRLNMSPKLYAQKENQTEGILSIKAFYLNFLLTINCENSMPPICIRIVR